MVTLQETELTPEQLMQVRDRSLEEAYQTHDIGHDLLVARLEAHGFHVEDHGDDARHADEVFFGDGPDLAVYTVDDGVVRNDNGLGSQYIDVDTGQFVPFEDRKKLRAYIEIKTKEKPKWFGRCNQRHYKEYVNFANETDVPVFVWFALVDADTDYVLRDAFVQVEDTDQIEGSVTDITANEVVFYDVDAEEVDDGLLVVEGSDVVGVRSDKHLVDGLPNIHGNDVVEINDDHFRSFPFFLHAIDE